MAGSTATPRDRKTEVSGSRRRRLPDIPTLKTVDGNRVGLGGFGENRRGITAEQHGVDGSFDVGRVSLKTSGSAVGDDLHCQSVGSEMQSPESAVDSRDVERRGEKAAEDQTPGCRVKPSRMFASRTDHEFDVDNDSSGTAAAGHHPGTTTSSSCRSHCRPSLFALMRTCRLVSTTLTISRGGIPGDEVIADDVIRLTETSHVAGEAGPRAPPRIPRSAFRPVHQATATNNRLAEEESVENVDDDVDGDCSELPVVSAVHCGVEFPGFDEQLLPGDILLEVWHAAIVATSGSDHSSKIP